MRFLDGARYRDRSRRALHRIERAAAEVNPFLGVVAIGLAMFDFLCLAQRFVDALPAAVVQLGAPVP